MTAMEMKVYKAAGPAGEEGMPWQAYAFAEGDVCRLKSGSPDMTVLRIREQGIVCIWMNSVNEIQTYTFHPETLTR